MGSPAMEIYIYKTPYGPIGDFRPYLDGLDHSFDPPRPLPETDPRWEKIVNLTCPRTGDPLAGKVEFEKMGEIKWHELLRFPTPLGA